MQSRLGDNQTNELIKLEGLPGYQDFMKALRAVSGEEVRPERGQEQANTQPGPNPDPEEGQIDSSARKPADTLDQIDPLFAQALHAPSIQAIKESDQIIKKI